MQYDLVPVRLRVKAIHGDSTKREKLRSSVPNWTSVTADEVSDVRLRTQARAKFFWHLAFFVSDNRLQIY